MEARSAITINDGAGAIYERWRDLASLPTFMFHLESVTPLEGSRSHWVAKAPAGTTVEWDAEITEEVPGQRLAWHSVEGSSVDNAGTVTFVPAPGGRGTEVHVELTYSPPGGALGAAVAKVFGEEPTQQLADDLRRFKQIHETGEIARSDANLHAVSKGQTRQDGAQPPEEAEVLAALAREGVEA